MFLWTEGVNFFLKKKIDAHKQEETYVYEMSIC